MAACGIREHVFEKPLTNDPILPPWKGMKPAKIIDDDISFPEMFDQLHIKASHESSASSSPFPISSPTSFSSISSTLTTDVYPSHAGIDSPNTNKNDISIVHQEKNCRSGGNHQGLHTCRSSSVNSETLSTCTDDLGVENSVNAADLSNDFCKNHHRQPRNGFRRNTGREITCIKGSCRKVFPPPISSIGRSGKPWVLFKSYKENGRFILKEVKVATQEFMHARREDGRLKLTFIQSESDDEFYADDEEEEEDDDGAY